ncbi:MAG TPA: c-type cytochrome [Eoetvoesiella sp.]
MYSRFFITLLCWASFGLSANVTAQTTGIDLAKSNNCLACHQVDKKRVGPSFTLVAQRFAEQDGALEYLANTIRHGGRGRWGAVPMPAQPQVSPANAQLIAAWILSLADKNLPEIK